MSAKRQQKRLTADELFERTGTSSYHVKDIDYESDKAAYNKREQELYAQFKSDLFEAFEVEDNPKRDMAFSIAWEHGHSSGYHDVALFFSDLADLIK